MKKLVVLLSGLLLCAGLAGCGGEQATDGGLTYDQLGIPGAAELAEGEGFSVVFGDAESIAEGAEVRGFYYDLAQDMRWDFLPQFEVGQAPAAVGDYLYLVMADALAWSDRYNIDHENTPENLSAEYVYDYVMTHFGVTVTEPEVGYVAKFDFDGEAYTPPATAWKNPPLYELNYLVAENRGGELVYTAGLTEYAETSSFPRNDLREVVVHGQADWAALGAVEYIEVEFTLDDKGEIVYRAVRDGKYAETWQDHGWVMPGGEEG